MKFMQRAAAASSPTSPSTPTSDDGHSSKRRKTAGRSSLGGDPETSSFVIDQKAAQAALDEDERQRQIVVSRIAEQMGDGHWTLDAAKLPHSDHQAGTPLKVVQVGFSHIDRRRGSDDDQEEEPATDRPRLQTYGPRKKVAKQDKASSFSPKTQVHQNVDIFTQSDSGSVSDSSSDESGSSDPSSEESGEEASQSTPGHGSYKRDELRSKRNAEREKARKNSSARRGKVVKLNQLTSISGASSYGSRGKPGWR